MSSGIGDDERDLLRQMVRQVLLEVVPQSMSTAPADDDVVVIGDDADLQAFVARIARRCEDADERAALAAGARRFRLAATASPATGSSTLRVEQGAVTERHVREAAESGAVLVLGRRAVLTPLARDRARAAGVEITKEK